MSLERNDVEGAIKVFRSAVLRGAWDPHMMESLYMLQDDPTELGARVGTLLKDPSFRRAYDDLQRKWRARLRGDEPV